jgi:diguanylate cyclase
LSILEKFILEELLFMVKDFFMNGSIIISFLFLAGQTFRNGPMAPHSKFKIRITLGVLSGILGSLLIWFSIHPTDTIIVDMRNIALIIATIYGGFVASLVATIIMVFTRVAFYGLNNASVMAIIVLVFLSVTTSLIARTKWSFKCKYILMNIISILISFTAFSILIDNKGKLIELCSSFGFIAILTAIYSYFVITYIQHSNELFRRYKEESKIDYLTGLYNVRQFDEIYNSHLKSVQERKEKLSVLMIDIDHFKKVNDTFGHPDGDLILEKLGSILKNAVRHFDIAARKGGEEFCILLLDCSSRRALEIAENIRSLTERTMFPISNGREINITVSIGVATFPETITDLQQLLQQADMALYASKKAGRNKVTLLNEI